MRILIYGIHFYPELTGVGKYTGELAAYLVAHDNEVRVVTAPLYYPYWQIQRGFKGGQYKREEWQGMQIFRVPLWVPRRPSGVTRLLHLFSFALLSFPVMLGQIRWKPALVLCVVPTFFSAPAAVLVARLSKSKSWLHVQDFELDAALGLDMMPGGRILASVAGAFERFMLTQFDRVSTISDNMLALAVEKGAARKYSTLLPNWVDTGQIFPLRGRNDLRGELNIPDEKQVVLYHGNMGRKQGLEVLIDAAARLGHENRLLFLFAGEGAARAELEGLAGDLPNVQFVELQPTARLNELVNLADVHVLPQRAGAADLVMPSKLTTMLASGKPVVACAAPGTQLWNVVSRVGVTVLPESVEELATAILGLLRDPAERARLGSLGREYACQYLEKELVLGKFVADLQAPEMGWSSGG